MTDLQHANDSTNSILVALKLYFIETSYRQSGYESVCAAIECYNKIAHQYCAGVLERRSSGLGREQRYCTDRTLACPRFGRLFRSLFKSARHSSVPAFPCKMLCRSVIRVQETEHTTNMLRKAIEE